MPQTNHFLMEKQLPESGHAASLRQKIAAVEAELHELAKHTLVWDETAKQLKKKKLLLRDELAAFKHQVQH